MNKWWKRTIVILWFFCIFVLIIMLSACTTKPPQFQCKTYVGQTSVLLAQLIERTEHEDYTIDYFSVQTKCVYH